MIRIFSIWLSLILYQKLFRKSFLGFVEQQTESLTVYQIQSSQLRNLLSTVINDLINIFIEAK
ncbi:hypothetical protein NIES2119_27710 [[Phormidium ambiguum] IAM M-71]|uniref:Uncharacterized protein n=1 Tax=[Phormidium ambiguum] IAM M-71 TaxID=454136 RepID=A0A1U7I6I1_9CYAN|nr:hypothetical protein NIES2119_27710 [Phormidium ambiguum IAM M-71]